MYHYIIYLRFTFLKVIVIQPSGCKGNLSKTIYLSIYLSIYMYVCIYLSIRQRQGEWYCFSIITD